MDTCLEVYPGYQRHRTAMHTVARFLGMEIWRVAETLSCRMRSYGRRQVYLVTLNDYLDKKMLNVLVQDKKTRLTVAMTPTQAMLR